MASNSRPNEQPQGSMAPPPVPAPAMDVKKVDINSLMSPPDAVLDSFNHGVLGMTRTLGQVDGGSGRPVSQQPLPMSPPVSPCSKPIATANAPPATPPSSQPIKDPVLYPHDEHSPQSPPQAPLFAPAELEHRRIVDEHVRARSQSIFAGVSPPRREDYELALTFRSQVMKHYTSDRKAWLRKERALLEADRRAGAQRYHAIMPAKPIAAKPAKARVSKTQAAPRQIRNNSAATAPARPARPAGRVSATPEPSRRIVAPNREDKDFDALPNYCPPLDSLPSRSNSLKVDWKGQPIDLSNDPNTHLLHPDEVVLAGNLRLDCATYLTSKRRIFERRLQCLRTGKEFRKTDAQQACKIDVNKASKLWTAFDRVGWLDAGWVRRFL
ncbi:SWIRM domain-containing protein FUN19 [Tolypocladium paradoxum]|uniref:SWIRM domain-containing protein FUN19 n=1 Tax=Tolypocladium paradoxum TaxID=94208 RepID=A0A2S4KVX4_9HYPO|nr:SWIRM domain-containing protein FUN19 [Tolypocladium paradoxum]